MKINYILPFLSLISYGIFLNHTTLAEQSISNELTISYDRPKKGIQETILGTSWTIFLSGQIEENSAEKFEAFLVKNKVPVWSLVVLNSPGGSLYGGMELGRIIRKYQLNTDVGTELKKKFKGPTYGAGECYSSCSYAYLGGKFRYLTNGSRYGVHRFYSSDPNHGNMDTAQITSAQIISYIREMGVDPNFFNLSTMAGSKEIFIPMRSSLEKLSVVNDGFESTSWSVESKLGIIYLKGQRETSFGINKFIMFCEPSQGLFAHVIFDPQGRDNEIMSMQAHSLVIDMNDEPITPVSKDIINGWFNGRYLLTQEQIEKIERAQNIGIILRHTYDSPFFFGFNSMPFVEASEKLVGIVNNCIR